MILRGFKKKSNKKYLNKLLSKRDVNVGGNTIKSLGVVIHIDEIDDFELFRALAKDLNVHQNHFQIIAYSSESKESNASWDRCYNEKDFGWRANIKNAELKSFIDTKFDVLISYYIRENVELKLITAASQAQFKIGVFQTDDRLNDLIIKTKINEFEVFKSELFKYLTILNKIKK